MVKLTFKELVDVARVVAGKTFTQIAKDMNRNSSEISNILSRRYASADLENKLADMAKAELKKLTAFIVGDTYPSHMRRVETLVNEALEDHRNKKTQKQ